MSNYGRSRSFFRHTHALLAWQLVEDMDQRNRAHEVTQLLVASESRVNDTAEAFGIMHDNQIKITAAQYTGTKPGQGMQVLLKPLSGLLNQNKMIPLRYAPITIELELVDIAEELIWNKYLASPGLTDVQATSNSLL